MIRAVDVLIPCMTSGSQKCIGARPNFIAKAIVSKVGVGCVVS